MHYTKDTRIAARKINGTWFLVSPWDHMLHKMNETSGFIWEMLDQAQNHEEIIDALTDAFDVNRQDAYADYHACITDLLNKKLIHTAHAETVSS